MTVFSNVLFDLDGTLLNTGEGITESISNTLRELGLPALSQEALLSFVGPPLQTSFMRHCACDESAAQHAATVFRGYYSSGAMFKASPYEGIYTLCDRLLAAGVRMGVATYKKEDLAVKVLERFSFPKYCGSIHGADAENRRKKEDVIRLCLEELHAAPQDCLYVGDTAGDAAAAEKAGVPFLAVSYGFGFKTEDDVSPWPHIGIVNTPLEIADYVLGRE